MIQRPDMDGPPDLDEFFNAQRRSVGASGEPVTLGTGRANLSAFGGDVRATVAAAFEKARAGLASEPQVCHCTMSNDVDPVLVANAMKDCIAPETFVLGRTVNKKDSLGNVEILLLRSDSAGGIAVSSATVTTDESKGSVFDPVNAACEKAAKIAASEALQKLDTLAKCTFMVFAHSPGATPKAARAGIDFAMPNVIAYGGPAVGDRTSGASWALISGKADAPVVHTGDINAQTAVVAAVPGKLSFLFSAVIKNWAQPAYTEPMSYMMPKYVDDPETDLLTAIRYDDWDKFLWCIETKGVSINHKWANKQNQIPLLAACARVRTRMIDYLIENGADVHHRNDGGFTAAMYTRMLTDYDRSVIVAQLATLEKAGAATTLTEEEVAQLKKATNGRIFE